jgi:hypothetical protein
MATKKQLAEQVRRILSGGTPSSDNELDPREIMLAIDQARDNMATMSVYENVKAGEFDIDYDYLKEYPSQTILSDTSRGLRYVDLPVAVLSLPHELGVYAIHPPKNPESAFIRMPPGSHSLYTGMLSFNVEAKTYYWATGDRIFFKNLDITLSEVHMTLCPSSKVLLESDTFLIPPGMEDALIKNVIQLMAMPQQIPHDEKTDGVK